MAGVVRPNYIHTTHIHNIQNILFNGCAEHLKLYVVPTSQYAISDNHLVYLFHTEIKMKYFAYYTLYNVVL